MFEKLLNKLVDKIVKVLINDRLFIEKVASFVDINEDQLVDELVDNSNFYVNLSDNLNLQDLVNEIDYDLLEDKLDYGRLTENLSYDCLLNSMKNDPDFITEITDYIHIDYENLAEKVNTEEISDILMEKIKITFE